MAYRRRYTGRYNKRSASMDRALEHIRAYEELESRLGPIVSDVRIAFLSLSPDALASLLKEYENVHGEKASAYAYEAYPLWKSGDRKMAGQTAERLLNLVPRYLSFDQRYQMVSRLCDYHAKKQTAYVVIRTDNPGPGLAELELKIQEFVAIQSLKYIPDDVTDVAVWLHDDDVVATRALLAQVDQARTEQVRAVAQRELREIYAACQSEHVDKVSHTIVFPGGEIHVNFVKPPKSFLGWLFGG